MHCVSRKPLWLLAAGIVACSSVRSRTCVLVQRGGLRVLAVAAYRRSCGSTPGPVFPAWNPSTPRVPRRPQFATGVPGIMGSFRLGATTILPRRDLRRDWRTHVVSGLQFTTFAPGRGTLPGSLPTR